MSADGTELNISVTNYPSNAGVISLRQLPFGVMSGIAVLLEVDLSDDETEGTISLTIDAGQEHEDLPTFLGEMIELLQAIVENDALKELGQ